MAEISSNLKESAAMDENGAGQVKNNPLFLDRNLYDAAVKGEIENFTPEDYEKVTQCSNTILHLYITALPNKKAKGINYQIEKFMSGKNSTVEKDPVKNFVEQILDKSPDLLHMVNSRAESLLHVAAKFGHEDIVEVLLTKSKDLEKGARGDYMVKQKNKEGDTPLHEAARYNHPSVVKKLIEVDVDLSYVTNFFGETPLYLAVERGYSDVVEAMLTKLYKSPAPGGPNGRTCLHAAVLRNDDGITKSLLTKAEKAKSILLQEADQQGWTPLHYACFNNVNTNKIVKKLLEDDSERIMGCLTTKTGRTSLHIAASRGKVEIMEKLIENYPESGELVDERGWNVLHFAVDSKCEQAIKAVLNEPSLRNLINEKNGQGQTPLDLVSSSSCLEPFKNNINVDQLALEQKMIVPVSRSMFGARRVGAKQTVANAEILASEDKLSNQNEANVEKQEQSGNNAEKKKSESKEVNIDEEAREAHLVVAALVATVSFAAGFTAPGGYIGDLGADQGGAILSRRAAFRAFVITNTIALALSSSAVLTHLSMTIDATKEMGAKFIKRETELIILSTWAMVVAFITGTYATLEHSSELAIAAAVIGCVLFAVNGVAASIIPYITIILGKILTRLGCLLLCLFCCWSCCSHSRGNENQNPKQEKKGLQQSADVVQK